MMTSLPVRVVAIVLLASGFAVGRQTETEVDRLTRLEICAEQKFSGSKRKHAKSADGQLTLALNGTQANLTQIETRKRVGNPLIGQAVWSPSHRFTFHCFTFSADGKYVITGSGFVEESKSKDGLKTNLGLIQMWDAANGSLIAELSHAAKLGSVREIALSEDGSTVVYRADRYSVDGK